MKLTKEEEAERDKLLESLLAEEADLQQSILYQSGAGAEDVTLIEKNTEKQLSFMGRETVIIDTR